MLFVLNDAYRKIDQLNGSKKGVYIELESSSEYPADEFNFTSSDINKIGLSFNNIINTTVNLQLQDRSKNIVNNTTNVNNTSNIENDKSAEQPETDLEEEY